MTESEAMQQAKHWEELHGLAVAQDGAGFSDDAEALRMQAADIELDLAEAGYSASALAKQSAVTN